MLQYEWDEHKDWLNQRKHGVSFADALSVFDDPKILSCYDEGHSSESEDRWISIGATQSGLICLVVHTFRTPEGIERIRIISARPATKREQKQYYSD